MAIEVFSDGSSPRISFSHDLPQSEVVPAEEYVRTSSSSSSDFDFCVFHESFDIESSSADELFSDGKILPIEIKRRRSPAIRSEEEPPLAPPRRLPPALPPLHPPPQRTQYSSAIVDEMKIPESEAKHKSFWRFKRSSSLNGGGGGGSFCPFPLLSRSNSTGSSASGKRIITSNQKQSFLRSSSSNNWQKQPQLAAANSAKPPMKRNNSSHGYYSPVLNVPPANLFGHGSIFSFRKKKQ